MRDLGISPDRWGDEPERILSNCRDLKINMINLNKAKFNPNLICGFTYLMRGLSVLFKYHF